MRRILASAGRLILTLSLAAPLAGSAPAPPAVAQSNLNTVCRQVALANLVDPQMAWLRPSPDYQDGNWLRDSFWITWALDQRTGRRALENFGRQLTVVGQAATRLNLDGVPDQLDYDESTLFYILWAYRDGGQPPGRLASAWYWVRAHVQAGAFVSPPGVRHSWHDTLVYPPADVSSYNQGIYAAAALAAVELGLAEPAEADAAIAVYRSLYRPDYGYLPVSLKLNYHDASALVGEFLARRLFGRPLLADDAVRKTVASLPRVGDGFLVLAAADGNYLPPDTFVPAFAIGDYQNGGTWLLYDVLAWLAADAAGEPGAREMAQKRLAAEAADNTLYEYIRTVPVESPRPIHAQYGWNAFACQALGLAERPRVSPVPAWQLDPQHY